MQMHDILGGDKQLVQELLHDMKQEAVAQKQAASAPAARAPSPQAGKSHKANRHAGKRLLTVPVPVLCCELEPCAVSAAQTPLSCACRRSRAPGTSAAGRAGRQPKAIKAAARESPQRITTR